MPSPAVLFPAVTESPAREFIAATLAQAGTRRLILPLAGRFAAAAAAAPVVGAKNIYAFDTGLLPSLLGSLADPLRTVEGLGVTVPPLQGIQKFVAGAAGEAETAAGIMAAVKYCSLPRDSEFAAEQRRQLRGTAAEIRKSLAKNLTVQAAALAGLTYSIGGVSDALAAADADPDACVVLDVHGLRTRAMRDTRNAEALFWEPRDDTFDVRKTPDLLASLTGAAPLILVSVPAEKLIPDGWVRLAATELAGRVDYVIGNRDPGGRHVRTRPRPKDAATWPLYADEEITPASALGVAKVDRATALHYRDLLIHRLPGSTVTERFYLWLVDGRAAGVFGLHFRDQVLGKTDYSAYTFGITITSDRYARLGKLMMLCLTSTDMLAFLLHTEPGMLQRRPPAGIQTSSQTVGHEGKADRGVMRLVSREPRKGGGFHLLYRTEWRDESWPEVVARWHREQAHHARPGWAGPRLDPPPLVQPAKKKRGRGAGRRQDGEQVEE